MTPTTIAADPVGLMEIADRLGVDRKTPVRWRQRGVFPEPRWTVSGAPAWNWPDIEEWARKTGRIEGAEPEPVPEPTPVVATKRPARPAAVECKHPINRRLGDVCMAPGCGVTVKGKR